jgi:hypothetical protein
MADYKTATKETIMHYRTPEVMETILRVSNSAGVYRWAVGDSMGWYKTKANGAKFAQPMSQQNYKVLTHDHRTLYSTLSFFDTDIFEKDFRAWERQEATLKSKRYVRAFTFGIDIDTKDPVNGHGVNIKEPQVKEAVEAMAKFFIEKLRAHAPNSVYALFSGGGIYVFVHHGVFKDFLRRFALSNDYHKYVDNLTGALNILIDELSADFYRQFPQHEPYVKADSLNNAKRVFKTIFSVHKKHPYAVIPLDIGNIKIDFEKATIPLKPDVLKAGKEWYTEYDDDNLFLIFMKTYMENVRELMLKRMQAATAANGGVQVSKNRFTTLEYPPCVKNILGRARGGNGATRALAFMAAFFGQIGEPEEEAKAIWYELAGKWGAATANVFDSWYQKMNCPSCMTLRTLGAGYPHIDLVNMGACKPDIKCCSVNYTSPVYYVDKELYIEKLKRDLCA